MLAQLFVCGKDCSMEDATKKEFMKVHACVAGISEYCTSGRAVKHYLEHTRWHNMPSLRPRDAGDAAKATGDGTSSGDASAVALSAKST